jgi:hypothetical protein
MDRGDLAEDLQIKEEEEEDQKKVGETVGSGG